MVGFNMLEHLWGGVIDDPSLGIGYSRMLTPHRRPYRTKDGYISVLAVNNKQWRRLFVAIDRPDLVGDVRFADIGLRAKNIHDLYSIVVDAMKIQTTAEWRRRLDAVDVPNGEVNDFDGLLKDQYLQETGFFQKNAASDRRLFRCHVNSGGLFGDGTIDTHPATAPWPAYRVRSLGAWVEPRRD